MPHKIHSNLLVILAILSLLVNSGYFNSQTAAPEESTVLSMLHDFSIGTESSYFEGGTFYNGKLAFDINGQLWISAGRPQGTTLLANVSAGLDPFYLHNGHAKHNYVPSSELNGVLYFLAIDSDSNNNLWRTDGTPDGTQVVANTADASFGKLLQAGNYLYLTHYQLPPNGDQLWRSDGTSAGTQLVQEFFWNADFNGFSVLNNVAMIDYGHQLYRSTESGDIEWFATLPNDASLSITLPLDGLLYFSYGNQNYGARLYQTNGETVQIIKDKESGEDLTEIEDFINLGNTLYISARMDDSAGLWKLSPGSTEAELIKAFSFLDQPSHLVELNNETPFFQILDASYNGTIWRSDGTEAGTQPLCPSCSFLESGDFAAAWQGNLYFAASDAEHGAELWITDGTDTETHLFADIQPGPASSNPQFLIANSSALFFAANDGIHGSEPWAAYQQTESKVYLPAVIRP